MKGFTSIELIMVIIILGIITSLGSFFIKDNTLYMQSNTIYLELKELRARGLNGENACMNIANRFLKEDYHLCFDKRGNVLNDRKEIHKDLKLKFKDKNLKKSITIYNMTGYVIIE